MDASINILEAVEMALTKIKRLSPAALNPAYLTNVRQGLEALKYNRRQLKAAFQPLIKSVKDVIRPVPKLYEYPHDKAKRVQRELLDAGATVYGIMKSESRFLPKILHASEHVEAIVYGQHESSSVMLAATDERIIFLDKKPMVALMDEVTYDVISGIELDIGLIFAKVTLHTPVKNYNIRFANMRCAEKFVRHIETIRLKRLEEVEPEPISRPLIEAELEPPRSLGLNAPEDDMAGYYWLPNEEEREKMFIGSGRSL